MAENRLTITQAAARYNISVATLRRAARLGTLPAEIEHNARNLPVWYVKPEDVERWAAKTYRPKMRREFADSDTKPGSR